MKVFMIIILGVFTACCELPSIDIADCECKTESRTYLHKVQIALEISYDTLIAPTPLEVYLWEEAYTRTSSPGYGITVQHSTTCEVIK